MPEKVYCGTQPGLPDGYSRFGNLFECLRKGYGVCLYSGKLGKGNNTASSTTCKKNNRFWLVVFIVLHLLCVVLLAVILYVLLRRH
jgi:hypothetical protein